MSSLKRSSSWRCAFLVALFVFSLVIEEQTCGAADDYIAANRSLAGDQTILSPQGKFVLGMYQPSSGTPDSSSSPKNYYLAIWYNNISPVTTVWVANRATPTSSYSSSVLNIDNRGNLVLLDSSGTLIWSTDIAGPAATTVAVLRDTGNLVLVDASNASDVLWQSIDNPSNTWLPGGKLVLNKATGKSQRLVSWKNSGDPSPGIYSLLIDPQGSSQYFIQWNDSLTFWSSGVWNPQLQIFSNVPEMTSNYIYSFQYVSNGEENYFTYSVRDDTIITRFVMDLSGQIKQMTWVNTTNQWILFWSQPRTQCGVYAFCGAFSTCNEVQLPYCDCMKGFSQRYPGDWALGDQTAGCSRNTLLQCQSGGGAQQQQNPDKFYAMAGVRLPVNAETLQAAGSSDACEQACLSNCSCTAYSYGPGCSMWFGDLLNLQSQFNGSDQGTLYLRLDASELPSSKSKKGLIAGAVVGGVVAVVAVSVALVWAFVWRKNRRRKLLAANAAAGGPLVAFRYAELQRMTKNFSERLGGGAFGSVFKGVLSDSTVIAVKKLEGVRQGEKQFRAEVSTIGTTQHVNLVRLIGFCCEGNERLLVYGYMPNGSLDTHLFQNSSKVMDWKTRYSVCVGVARGLTYLHEECRECIIHCDIKPENILLDDSFVPKVADFGLSKIMGHDFSRVLTTMRGTRGYLAPEWISGLAITAKADVYSYGMMLLEIISGRRNSDQRDGNRAGFFPIMVASKLKEDDDVFGYLDPRMERDMISLEEVKRVCKAACWCIQDDENSRPSMGQVVQILEGVVEVDVPPLPRALQFVSENPENIVFFSEFASDQASSQVQTTTFASSKTKSTSTVSSVD